MCQLLAQLRVTCHRTDDRCGGPLLATVVPLLPCLRSNARTGLHHPYEVRRGVAVHNDGVHGVRCGACRAGGADGVEAGTCRGTGAAYEHAGQPMDHRHYHGDLRGLRRVELPYHTAGVRCVREQHWPPRARYVTAMRAIKRRRCFCRQIAFSECRYVQHQYDT